MSLDARSGSDALRRFVLYVDQGEELYSRAPATDAHTFSALLAEAARQPDFHVLASLRSDYYGQLQADAALFPGTQRIDIPPLPADRLETVIRRPAERLGARFDFNEMPSQIAAATLDEPGALPLLSYLMSDMWADMQERGDGILRWSERPEVIDIAAPLRERAERYLYAQSGQGERVAPPVHLAPGAYSARGRGGAPAGAGRLSARPTSGRSPRPWRAPTGGC